MTESKEPTSPDELVEQFLRNAHAGAVSGSLAGGLAHHFNNLLGGVLGLATLAPSLGKKELENLCGRVRQQVEDASRLTRVLLSVTRSRESSAAGTLCEINSRSDDLVALVEACAGSTIDVEISLPDDEVWANIPPAAYSELFLSVMIGLVFAPRLGNDKVIVRAKVATDEAICCVTIEAPTTVSIDGDSGSVTRAVQSGADVLTPLAGLAAARTLAVRAGGSVDVDRTADGLRFSIRLPRKQLA